MMLYRGTPGSWFAYKLRENADIRLEDGTMIKRNVYGHYVSNSSPVYIRHNKQLCFVDCENYQTDHEVFIISLRSKRPY